MTTQDKILKPVHMDTVKASNIMTLAKAYKDFRGNPIAYAEEFEYETISEARSAYEKAKGCYDHVTSVYGSCTDIMIEGWFQSSL